MFATIMGLLRGLVLTFLISICFSYMLNISVLKGFIIVYLTAWLVFIVNDCMER